MTAALLAEAWHWLADPWGEPLVRRALAEIVLLAAAGGAIGSWVVLYELPYAAESLAHSMLPGLVVATLVGAPLLLGAAGGILVAAAAVSLAARVGGIEPDTAVAVAVTTLLGLGALLALSPEVPAGLEGLLFGDVLGVTDGDLALAAAALAIVATALWLLHPRLLAVGFDRRTASLLGVRPGPVDLAVLTLLAVTLLVAVQGLGNLLVVALLVGPAAAARRVTVRAPALIATAVAIAGAAGLAGLYLSYHAGTAAGASIAGLLVAAYLPAAVIGRRRRVAPA